MKIAYLQCATGISGDMVLAALIDAGVSEQDIQQGVASLGLPDVTLSVDEVMRGCFRASKVTIEHPEQHSHRHLSDILAIIEQAAAITQRQKQIASDIFQALAQAEARVHGTDTESIHFHEVGAIDSIVDIVGAAIGFDLLGADQIHCSAIPPGRGTVTIEHGICPVPTPGTVELLKGIPLADVPIEAELTTPTGAAIVKTLVDRFGPLPPMTINQVGYGAGTMEFPNRGNLLRLFVGSSATVGERDEVCLLETNLDDVTGEVIGHTKTRLLSAGALDVYTIPIQMKKNRPGVILSVIGHSEQAGMLEDVIFQETGTLGIRRQLVERSTRARKPHQVLTPFGPVSGKVSWFRSGASEFSPEFDDCARLAEAQGKPLREIYRAALTAFDQQHASQHAEPLIAEQQAHGTTTDSHRHEHDDAHDHDHDHDHP